MDILKRQEAIPESYPHHGSTLSDAADALDKDMIWQRIESYIAHRWSVREVIWTVTGPGEFVPDLTPATITAQEVWDGTAWITTSLDASALGGVLLAGEGPYRLTADVGGGTVPKGVSEAFRRLAEYMAEQPDRHGAGRYDLKLGEMSEGFDRSAKWVAQAMQLSGAADLLRNYRRA